ncbi:hypothetical protein AVDCRST_MAG81-279 [uncultured Synechococcales cyanobacterium]|uniref:Uncharacterized protein n=1 Tax=uncultured Synechococcales cyanobacterium TaxID=1936017 RepID=A0A6J4UJM6_9CYAN|nr:hypothetical protein AVDCRST_MAG81-279 [uncultured Synechococcales cyanobacterium]
MLPVVDTQNLAKTIQRYPSLIRTDLGRPLI